MTVKTCSNTTPGRSLRPRPATVRLACRAGSSPGCRCSSPRCRGHVAGLSQQRCTRRPRRSSSASMESWMLRSERRPTVRHGERWPWCHLSNSGTETVKVQRVQSAPVDQVLELLHGFWLAVTAARQNFPSIVNPDDPVRCVDEEATAKPDRWQRRLKKVLYYLTYLKNAF